MSTKTELLSLLVESQTKAGELDDGSTKPDILATIAGAITLSEAYVEAVPEPPPEPEPEPGGTPGGAPIPDFTQDPLAIVIEFGEELIVDELLDFTTIQVKGVLTLLPGTDLVKLDVPLDTAFDPDQIGHGILVMEGGRLNAVGTSRLAYSRSALGIEAGANRVDLMDMPDGWEVGDKIAIANSQQQQMTKYGGKPNPDLHKSEVVTITAIAGAQIEFEPALSHDHPAGALPSMTPHVALFDRDIKISSESTTNPGHIMFMEGAEATVRDVQITSFGRTTNEQFDTTTFFPDGSVEHHALNHPGRYALHTHRMGDSGQNVVIENNSIRNSKRWGINFHSTNYATIENNFFYNFDGAAIVCQDQSAHGVIVRGNLCCRGTGVGRGGSTNWGGIFKAAGPSMPIDLFWMGSGISMVEGRANIVEDNVVCDCLQHGLVFSGYGQDKMVSRATDTHPTVSTKSNEVYACGAHTLVAHPQGVQNPRDYKWDDVHNNMVGWNLRSVGVETFHTMGTKLNRPIFYNDPVVSSNAEGNPYRIDVRVPICLHFGSSNYTNGGCELIDPVVEGWVIGLYIPVVCHPEQVPWFRAVGGHFKNLINVLLTPSQGIDRDASVGSDLQVSDMQPVAGTLRYHDSLNEDGSLKYPNIARHSYDVWASLSKIATVDFKSDLDLIGYRDTLVKVFITEDPAATCTETDERIRGFICEM